MCSRTQQDHRKSYNRKGRKITIKPVISEKEKRKFLDILELGSEASALDIKNAYIHLRKLYSTDSSVISPITKDFSKRRSQVILKQLEEAYTKLMALKTAENHAHNNKKVVSGADMDFDEEEIPASVFNGQVLRDVRIRLGIQLSEVSIDTKIRVEILQNIESENFAALPPEVYLKGHLINYAKYLSLKPKKVADDYIKLYRAGLYKTP